MHITKRLTSIAVLAMLVLATLPVSADTTASERFALGEPFEQDAVLTAYYSPKPDQCCYVTGTFESDAELNGQGFHAADGTAVYPGMLAAPASYPFGTRVVVPGVGTFTVHDRGGAIVEQGATHRFDVWAGEGEEGLARALAFGVQRVRVKVYPPTASMPTGAFALADLPAPLERLKPYFTEETTLLDLTPELNDHSASVEFLQRRLKDLGLFNDSVTGTYGVVTRGAVAQFIGQMKLSEPDDRLTLLTAAYMEAAHARADVKPPVVQGISARSEKGDIAQAQRILRFLGFYEGRTSGIYDETLRKAILAFQIDQKVVGSATDTGAGTIGPKTQAAITALWNRKIVAEKAEHLLALHKVNTLVAERGFEKGGFLGKGDHGERVTALQKFLADRGYFSKKDVNGNFGDLTETAVLAFQKDQEIITKTNTKGAGYVGPATMNAIRRTLRTEIWRLVRSAGWQAV